MATEEKLNPVFVDVEIEKRPKKAKAQAGQHSMTIFLSMALLGASCMLPWNAVIAAFDYYKVEFPGEGVIFDMTTGYMTFNVICLMLVIKIGPRISFDTRFTVGYALYSIVLVFLPYMRNSTIAIGLVCLLGVADAIVRGSLFGFCGLLHPRYTSALMTGGGFAGILACILRIITKATHPNHVEGHEQSCIIFFSLSALIVVSAIGTYQIFVRRHRMIRECVGAVVQRQKASWGKLSLSYKEEWLIAKRVWPEALVLMGSFFTTLCLFPGITTEMTSKTLENHWFPLLLVTTFNVFDFAGRTSTRWEFMRKLLPQKWLGVLAASRLVFFPLFIFNLDPKLLHGDAWMYCVMPFFGFTNGYAATLAFRYGPTRVEPERKEVASIVLVLAMIFGYVWGVWGGSLLKGLVDSGWSSL